LDKPVGMATGLPMSGTQAGGCPGRGLSKQRRRTRNRPSAVWSKTPLPRLRGDVSQLGGPQP
jgi:hypothetical protein